jgi:hypothetical protein
VRIFGRGRGIQSHVRPDVIHADRHTDTADQEEVPAAKAVDEVVHRDAHRHEADHAVYAGADEGGGRAVEAQGFEDPRGIVVDGIATGHLHKDKDEDADGDAASVSGTGEFAEFGDEAFASGLEAFFLDLGDDCGRFFEEVGVGWREGAELGEDLDGGFAALGTGCPSAEGITWLASQYFGFEK